MARDSFEKRVTTKPVTCKLDLVDEILLVELDKDNKTCGRFTGRQKVVGCDSPYRIEYLKVASL